MNRRYPPELHEFLKQFIPGHTAKEISLAVADRFGIEMTPAQVKSYKQNRKIRSGTPCGSPAGSPSKTFPQKVGDYIRSHYQGVGPKEMVGRLNETFGTSYTIRQVSAWYKNHGLNSGLDGRFQKGHVPVNKGKKGMVMHPNAVATQFRAGHRPANKLPIGTVLEKADGYLWRKIGEGARDWRQEHILRYEETYGPLPPGGMITFLDGDKHNVELGNLKLITNDINLELNRRRLRTGDPELNETAILIADLSTKTRKRKKQGDSTAQKEPNHERENHQALEDLRQEAGADHRGAGGSSPSEGPAGWPGSEAHVDPRDPEHDPRRAG